jgi:cytolysin-activating lysine-acyltransferase
MFKFGRGKGGEATSANDPSTPISPASQPDQDAIAIGDGKAKAAPEAMKMAGQHFHNHMPTTGEAACAGIQQEEKGMDHSAENQRPNGDGAQAGASSVFTEAAPAGAAKKVSEVLGEIVWLMSQSPIHKRLFIQDLEWFVMTPILLKQFRLFYAKDRPLGVVFWSYANDEVAAMLAEGTTKLRPQDWDCRPRPAAPGQSAGADSTQVWVVEVIAPFGGAEEIVKDLKAKVFPGREVRYLVTAAQGKQVKVA